MRNISAEFMDLPTLCWVWRLTLTNGNKLAFTDHDRALVFEELACAPQSGFTPGDIRQSLGLEIDDASVQGALDSQMINPEDIKAGKFDRAAIETFRVNWQSPDQYEPVSSGYLGDIRLRGGGFEADILGEDAKLSRATGRVFSRLCSAEFGDRRCGLDPADFPDGTICPRSFAACREQFSNTVNFRGFPYLLGDDALLAGPIIGEARDGGSRFS